jgi:ribonuclease J
MRVCIHRGSHEIGGSCVEIEHGGQRLVLDAGRPLDSGLDTELPLPPVEGLASGDPSLLGVIVSHGHPDHYGLVPGVHPSIPIYLGQATERILRDALFFSSAGADLHPAGYLVDRQPLRLGPFIVTPLLVDHSAFDSYALLVDAGDRRLLYSGDLRSHGRKPGAWRRMIEQPPADVNVMLLEGTRLSRTDEATNITEADVEQGIADLCRDTAGMVLACYSAQNIDRLVSVYRAARKTGRTLVIDLYGATIAAATGLRTIPQPASHDVRVWVPHSQRRRVIEAQAYDRMNALRAHRIFPEQLRDQATGLVLTMRSSMTKELERADCLDGAVAVWSMWPGYLEQPGGQRLRAWLSDHLVPLTTNHASGHASVADLQALAIAVAADRVVPIHTAAPDHYRTLFPTAEIEEDGSWWPI